MKEERKEERRKIKRERGREEGVVKLFRLSISSILNTYYPQNKDLSLFTIEERRHLVSNSFKKHENNQQILE